MKNSQAELLSSYSSTCLNTDDGFRRCRKSGRLVAPSPHFPRITFTATTANTRIGSHLSSQHQLGRVACLLLWG